MLSELSVCCDCSTLRRRTWLPAAECQGNFRGEEFNYISGLACQIAEIYAPQTPSRYDSRGVFWVRSPVGDVGLLAPPVTVCRPSVLLAQLHWFVLAAVTLMVLMWPHPPGLLSRSVRSASAALVGAGPLTLQSVEWRTLWLVEPPASRTGCIGPEADVAAPRAQWREVVRRAVKPRSGGRADTGVIE